MPKKALVAYYSWSNGNTERIAEQVAEAMGADVERIETAEPYPDDYDETVEQGHREVNEGFEPELAPLEHDPAGYDLVVVGTPTWWYSMAPAVRSFLDTRDWSGKTVVPFMTNAGWPGTVIDDMEDAASGADIKEPLEVRFDSSGGDRMVSKQREVDAWCDRVKALAR